MGAVSGGEARDGVLSVFVDESGDLGFSGRSSAYFVICALATSDPSQVRRAMKRVRQRTIGKNLKSVPELKFSASTDSVRERVLRMIARLDVEVWYVCLRKGSRGSNAPELDEAYGHLAGFLVETIARSRNRNVFMILDRFLPKKAIERFNESLAERGSMAIGRAGKLPQSLIIEHIDSQSEPCLQAADFVAGAVFTKFERGDSRFYDSIKARITEEIIKWKW
jgi:hypothetical protein